MKTARSSAAIGKVTGDAKLEVEGKSGKTVGTVQNAAGKFKEQIKSALKE